MLNQHLIVNLSILFDRPTGIATYAGNIIPYLKQLNPTLLTSREYPDFNCYPIASNMTPLQGKVGHFSRLLWTQFQVPKIYQQLGGTLLFSPLPEAPLGQVCRTVVMVHDLIPLRFPSLTSPLSHYFRHYAPIVLKNALHIICNSQATAKDIVDYYHIEPEKITAIPLGYDPTHFRPQPPLSQGSYFLYVGRQDPYKNLHRLIAAFAALPQRGDYQLYVVGTPDPRYSPKLLEIAKSHGVQEQVKFLNYVSYQQLPSLYSGAQALVFPSLWEGFGIPALEAMACGTPVITSNISALPEVVGDAGLLVDPYSVQSITEALVTVLADSQLRLQMSHLGLERAAQLSWDTTGKKTQEVLQRYI